MTCYGKTVGGSHCELPEGHYPATQHLITFEGRSWMSWTDEAMADFKRIADERREHVVSHSPLEQVVTAVSEI